MKKKISLVGSGQIGGTIAHLLLLKQVADVVLFDINVGVAKGKALDLMHSAACGGFLNSVIGTDDYKDLQGSDIVVVTAGIPRKPGMTRDDLIETNLKVMCKVGKGIAKYCPEAFVICVTNPLDAMVWSLQQFANLPDNMICGMSGVLDSSRFRYLLADKLNISWQSVDAHVLGGHGDTMVPLTAASTVGGISLDNLLTKGMMTKDDLDDVINKTKFSGGEVVKLLGSGSAYFAPATSVLQMITAYIHDTKQIFSCSSKLVNGEYGVSDNLFVGVPSLIGSSGVESILQLDLSGSEQFQFDASVDAVSDLITVCKKLIPAID